MADFRLPYDGFKAGQKYMVSVKGWPMLEEVEEGNYRIEIEDLGKWFGLCANFFRPKGKKRIVTHRLENCFLSYPDCPDNNAIIVTGAIHEEVGNG